ncbi:FAD:protein FMN transferase [Dysgonomonas sp. Marseille-P4677]|uniref:FAD:protein FMN transferase n=1 Tax=Dysgonomonas sp. Marseille-P4677 TaxID=2364790 RepID=UPI001914920A|nr:FAD:protein FMN transferase [Dysgonomonas sp. Marseille-P4677]MBK5721066.1 FAD:protein FMN transferase [Dysgonomonas sp. Marseille-P4677]
MNTVMADNGTFYYNIQGTAEGTSYNIIYQDDEDRDFQPAIEALLVQFEKSLSVYDETSIISRVNRNEKIETDYFFQTVFNKAKEISNLTEGTFDISAEPLFRAWGFSSQEKHIPNEAQITDLKQHIGMDKIRIENNFVIKSNPNIVLNANAIAKGYSADLISLVLEEYGCENFLVEIGGEIRLKGVNTEGQAWRIGIDRPSEDNPIPGQNLQVILQITDRGIATSGNYRQFYIENGQKVAHTINPATGYPVKHNLLSTTVIAKDAITADAFATAFLVAGVEKALEWINLFPELDAIFIYDEAGEYKMYYTPGIEENLILST